MKTNSNISPISAQPERRQFKMDAALLWSVIQSQAGSPEKALLEAVMNAMDAGATRCEVSINETGYTVVDDGGGFKSRHEIEAFFETFGTPHKEGDATYGTYRMGRGQLFAFSKTTWVSGMFTMEVDIKKLGLEYDLHNNDIQATGCSITGTWYETIDSAEVIRIGFDLKQLAQWMKIPVMLNGRQVNKHPDEHEWTEISDDAYIKLKTTGGLSVYNLGALVRTYPAHQFGVSGTIVSKKQISVNFARNDILISKCDVWRRIRRIMDKHSGNLVRKKTPLHSFEYQALANRFARGELQYAEIAHLGLLVDVSGKRHTLSDLSKVTRLCVVPDHKDWTIGERVMNQKMAFVLRSESIYQFGVETPQEFIDFLKSRVKPTTRDILAANQAKERCNEIRAEMQAIRQYGEFYAWHRQHPDHDQYRALDNDSDEAAKIHNKAQEKLKYEKRFDGVKVIDLADVAGHLNQVYELLDDEVLSPHQKALLEGLRKVSLAFAKSEKIDQFQRLTEDQREQYYEERTSGKRHEHSHRRVIVGRSDVAQAWTDGVSYVAVDQDVLRDVLANKSSVSFLVSLMLHEFCHEEPDAGGHIHSLDFFQKFHEIMLRPYLVELLRYHLVSAYAKAIAAMDKKPNSMIKTEIKRNSKLLGVSVAQEPTQPEPQTESVV